MRGCAHSWTLAAPTADEAATGVVSALKCRNCPMRMQSHHVMGADEIDSLSRMADAIAAYADNLQPEPLS